MGQLVFQATLGGQVALVGPNTASSYSLNLPTVNGNVVTTGDTGTVTNTMLASSAYTAPGTIGSGTPNTGSFTSLAYSTTLTGGTGIVNLGSGQFYKDASGNVGIGTASPTSGYKLNIADTAAKTQITSTTGTNVAWSLWNNTGGNAIVGIESSAGGSIFSGTSAYSMVVGHGGGYPVAFATSNTERMRIDSSGNVMIGTTTPRLALTAAQSNTTGMGVEISNLSIANNTTKYSQLQYSGYDTVGTYKPSGQIIVNPGDQNYVNSYMSFVTRYADALVERMRIDTGGNLLIGTGSGGGFSIYPSYSRIGSTGAIVNHITGSASGESYFQFQYNGTGIGSITQSGTTGVLFNITSDYRLKENPTKITNGLETIQSLNPVNFTWKPDGTSDSGFLAHEFQSVLPRSVVGEKDATREEEYEITPAIPAVLDEKGNVVTPAVEAVMGTRTVPVYQAMDNSGAVPFLVAAIQEQQALITSLTARIVALEAK